MTPPPQARLTALLPAITTDWLERLRGEPALSPLGRRDTLAFLMRATLLQLRDRPEIPATGPWRPVASRAHRHHACGLAAVLKYHATGEAALAAVAGPALGEDLAAVRGRFRDLAAYEARTLCATCIRAQLPGCDLRAAGMVRSMPP